MNMKKIIFTIALACFITSNAQNITTNGTILLDDATSRTRVVVDAFLNSSNRVHELIEEVAPSSGGDFTTNNTVLVNTIETVSPKTSLEPATNYTDEVTGVLSNVLITGEMQVWNARISQDAQHASYADVAGALSDGESSRTASQIFSALDASSHITTNDVCAIVTNEVVLKAIWNFSEGFSISNVVWTGLNPEDVTAGVVTFDVFGAFGNAHISSTSSFEPYFIATIGGQEFIFNLGGSAGKYPDEWGIMHAGEGYISYLGSEIESRNALGLARLSDIPPAISNTVTKAYVEDLGIKSGVDAQTVTNMTSLSPVYGGNGKRFSAWTITPPEHTDSRTGETYPIRCVYDQEESIWILLYNGYGLEGREIGHVRGSFDGVMTVSGTLDGQTYTANRTENQIIGYTLGSQTNSVLAATNSLISASTITNLAPTRAEVEAGWWSEWTFDQTLTTVTGLKYDDGLGWCPVDAIGSVVGISKGDADSDRLTWAGEDAIEDFTATRHRVAAPVPTKISDLTNDVGYVSSSIVTNITTFAIANADTTYRRTIGITNINQSVQYVNITDPSPTTLAITMPTDGVTKDWMVYVVSVTNVTLSLPAATWWMADAAYTNDVPPATPTALWFSQVTDGVFILGRQELTPVSIEGGN